MAFRSDPRGLEPFLENGLPTKIGRDPRKMTPAEFQALGHQPAPLLKAIRAKCLDCCCYQAAEVRRCVATSCSLWPYRMGTNPLRPVSEARREASRKAAERGRLSQKSLSPGPLQSDGEVDG